MKKLLPYTISFWLFLSGFSFAQNAEKITWHSFEDAIKLNSENHKMVFIDIYTDWCGWCKVLDKSTFPDTTIIRLMNKYFIAVKLNAERKDTVVFNGYTFVNPNPDGYRSPHQLASSLLKGKLMYPSMCFLDDSVRLITTVQSYLKPNELEPILEYIGSEKYLTMTYDSFKLSYKIISSDVMATQTENKTMVLNKLKYDAGAINLTKDSYAQLDSLAIELKKNAGMKIEIAGYSDNSTQETADPKISENRAKTVYDYMVSKGIESTRMSYAGYGILKPIADNSTEEGRKLNRRVEVKIISN
jgi:outer membrane protein OmpA-like peptidoglycan-associated protein